MRPALTTIAFAVVLAIETASCSPPPEDGAAPTESSTLAPPSLPDDSPFSILSTEDQPDGSLILRVLPKRLIVTDRTGKKEAPLHVVPAPEDTLIVQSWVHVPPPDEAALEIARRHLAKKLGPDRLFQLQLVPYQKYTVTLSAGDRKLEHPPIQGEPNRPATLHTVIDSKVTTLIATVTLTLDDSPLKEPIRTEIKSAEDAARFLASQSQPSAPASSGTTQTVTFSVSIPVSVP